jgi:hypothetical protein
MAIRDSANIPSVDPERRKEPSEYNLANFKSSGEPSHQYNGNGRNQQCCDLKNLLSKPLSVGYPFMRFLCRASNTETEHHAEVFPDGGELRRRRMQCDED